EPTLTRVPDRPARLRRLARTTRTTAALVVALLGAGVYGALSVGPAAPSVSGGGNAASIPSTTTVSVPAGALLVTGIVTTAQLGQATGPDLSLPLQITVPVRGRGSASFYNVSVGGQPATVVWQGEEPMDLSGQGAVVPGRVTLSGDGNGSTWHLYGAEG